jgi:RHS repeat-associated protein
VRVATNASGQVVRRHEFLPFGEEWQPAVPPGDPRLFTGQERDPETGLDYFGARYYRADIGRFTTTDPDLDVANGLFDPQTWNRYAYVRNNPLGYTDPDGRFPVAVAAAVPGPQQIFVVAGLGIGAAVVIAESPKARKAFVDAWMAAAEAIKQGVETAKDRLSGEGRSAGERHGGGKTGRKLNEDRRESAEKNYEDAKRRYEEADRKRNKTPVDKARRDQFRKEMEHWHLKMRELSEEHARKSHAR